jgi:hypothetical protein
MNRSFPFLCAAAVLGVAATAAADEPATRVAHRSSDLPAPLVHEGWRFSSQGAPAFPIGDLGSRTQLNGTTGFSARVHVGYEYLFGNFGIEPGFAFQVARFGQEDYDGGYLYLGAQPDVKAQLHLGRIAPYATIGFGFDHLSEIGASGEGDSAAGYNTSANGIGFDLAFGADIIVSHSVSIGMAWQIHPGFTTLQFAPGGKSFGLGFMSILFGCTYLI